MDEKKYLKFEISDAEREKIIAEVMPENELEGFVWHAVDLCVGGVIYLFPDELCVLIEMAKRLGLDSMAARLAK